MASLFNSKHNKYVSIPDWFKDVKPVEELKIETKTTYIGGGGVSSISGLSNITIYNKFVLKDAELDNEALIIKDIALNGIETEEHKIGDEISAIGWNTTEYTSIAGSSTMTVTSTIIENQYGFGVFFYDNTSSYISNIVLLNAIEEVIVPANAYYFRISVPANDESFNVRYNRSEAYNSEQLALSDKNVTDYLTLNDLIPEGKNETVVSGNSLKLLVQSPLSLTKDVNNVVKLSIGNIIKESSNDMFVWDKKLAAFGYDDKTGTAYSYVEGEQLFTTDSQGNQVPVTTDNPEFWMYDEALSDKWIIKSTRPRISWLDNLIEYDEEKNYFKLHGDLLVTGGVTMYATKEDDPGGGGGEGEGDEDDPELPENIELVIEELKKTFVTTTEEVQDIEGVKNFLNGLSIGTRRMYEWKDDVIYLDSNLVVRGGITMYGNTGDVEPNEWYTSLPVADPLYWDYSSGSPVLSLSDAIGSIDSISVTGDGNAITGATLTDNGKSISFTKSIKFATFDELLKKADKEYVDLNFVTLKGDPQTIESQKNFTGGLLVNGNEIVYDTSTNCWKLDGNLLISGGITMYNINPASIPSFMQSLLLDDKTLELNDAGELTVKAGAGGTGGIDEEQLQSLLNEWGYVTDKDSLKNPYSLSWSGYSSGSYDGSSTKSITIPNNTNQLTNGAGYITASALDGYLPLTGGTLTGDLTLCPSNADYGSTLTFGDAGYAYIAEDEDDHLLIYARTGINMSIGSDYAVEVDGRLRVHGIFTAKGTYAFMPKGDNGYGLYFKGCGLMVHSDYNYYANLGEYSIGEGCFVFASTPKVSGVNYLADRTWVNNNYLSLSSGGTVKGNVTMASGTTLYVETIRSASGNWMMGGNNNIAFGGNYAGYSTTLTGATLKLFGGATERIRITDSELKFFQSKWTDDGIKLIRTSGSNAGAGISVYGIDTYKGCFGISGSEVFEFHSNTGGLCFSVDKGGNGIFKANTGFGLTIDRTSSNGGAYTRYRPNNQTNQSWTVGASNGYYFSVYYQNVASGIDAKKMTLDSAGNLLVIGGVTMYGTSDKRLKQNIRTFSASEELMKLGGVYQFEYVEEEVKRNEKYKGTHFGLIYQNVKESSLSKMCMEREDGFGALNYLDTSFISLLAAVGMEHETRLLKLELENKVLKSDSNTSEQIKELKEKIIELENRLKQYEYGSNT